MKIDGLGDASVLCFSDHTRTPLLYVRTLQAGFFQPAALHGIYQAIILSTCWCDGALSRQPAARFVHRLERIRILGYEYAGSGHQGRPPGITAMGAPPHKLGSPSSKPGPMQMKLSTVVHRI
jgi:hypothetical protein